MAGITFAYKTTDPRIIERVRSYEAQSLVAEEALRRLKSQFDPDDLFTVMQTSRNTFAYFVEKEPGSTPPDGFHRTEHKGRDVIVPDRRTAAGRQAAELIASHNESVPMPAVYGLVGMPALLIESQPDGDHAYSPGVVCSEDGTVYAVWRCHEEPGSQGHRGTRPGAPAVDLSVWQKVPLSEFYAFYESLSDRQAVPA